MRNRLKYISCLFGLFLLLIPVSARANTADDLNISPISVNDTELAESPTEDIYSSASNKVGKQISNAEEPMGDYTQDEGFLNSDDVTDGCPITINAFVMEECQDQRYSAYVTFLSETGKEYMFQLTKSNNYRKYAKLPEGNYTFFGGICDDNRRIYTSFSYQSEFFISASDPVYFECLIGTSDWISENKCRLSGYVPEESVAEQTTELDENGQVTFTESNKVSESKNNIVLDMFHYLIKNIIPFIIVIGIIAIIIKHLK